MPENTPDKKSPVRRLSPAGRRALEMLTNSETSSVTEAILMAYGFPATLLAGMAQDGLVREAIGTMRAGARMLRVRRLSITAAGRLALNEAQRRRPSKI